MSALAQSESKASNIIKKLLTEASESEPSLKKEFDSITLKPFIAKESSLPKIMILTMSLQVLINVKLQYAELMNKLKKEFPGYIILTRRIGEIPSAKISTPIREREDLISDLIFPSVVVARTNEVESRAEQTQIVYLDSKSLCWSKDEIASIEKLLINDFGQNFKIKIFGVEF